MTSTSGVALVTGASKGIGPYIARSLAEAGYRLVLTGRSAFAGASGLLDMPARDTQA